MKPSLNSDLSPANKRKIALTIELDQGKKETVFILQGDSAEKISKEIALKHNLNSDLEVILRKMIEDSTKFSAKHSEPSASKQKSNIHNRLYMESKYTKRAQLKPNFVVVPEKLSSHSNYGDLLYQQSKIAENNKWKNNIRVKVSMQEKVDKELTFHPQIPSRETSNFSSNSELVNRSKVMFKRPERSSSNRQLEECSFKPKINSQLQTSGNVHEKLYLQALIKQKATAKAEKVTKNKETIQNDQERALCIARLLNSHIFTEAKIKKHKEKIYAPIDSETNQEFFHPKIGREPQVQIEKPVWDRLYNIKSQEKIIDPEDIYKKFRKIQYQQIFSLLDQDQDGLVSSEDLDSEDFDEKSRLLLGKLLGKIFESINFEKFSESIEANINYLTMEDRMWLLRRNNNCNS